MSRRGGAGAAGWPVDGGLLAVVALVAAALVGRGVAGLTPDSDAYLDVAANLLAGRGLVQSVVDFWRPAVPDPLGMWPPLYPGLVAAVGAFGVPLELAARLVAGASLGGFAFAFHRLASPAVGRAPAALVTLFVLLTPGFALLGAAAWSEATMLAFLAGGLAVLAGDGPPGRGRALAAGGLLGLAVLCRHAALPAVLAVVAAALAGPRLRGARLRFAASALLPPALWLAHNVALFGHPFGPALPAGMVDPATRAYEMARAVRWEFLPAPFERAGPGALVVGGLVLAGGALAVRAGGVGRAAIGVGGILLATVLAATSLSAINAPTGRYIAPALPFLALGALAGLRGRAPATGAGEPGETRRTLATGFAAVLAVAALVDFLGFVRLQPVPAPGSLERRADRGAIASLLPADGGVVLSNQGHLVRAATGRAAVQIPPPAFRPRDYGEADDARWAGAGVDEAVMSGGAPPPAGRWERGATAGRFTRWTRVRTAP